MSSIAVITDTDASLPQEIAARYNIQQVPISIQFGAQTYDTGKDIDDKQLFARVDRDGRLPTTAAPAAGKFADAYQAAFHNGAQALICFCVSSKVSASYQSALAARDLLPGRDISVVDSNTMSMGQGFMAIAAAEALAAGATKADAVGTALDVGGRSHLFAALSTLKYLAMSGRVGTVAAGMASLLNVKPILTIRDGKLDLLERVRTQKKAWSRLVELCVDAAAGNPVQRMALIHVNARDEALSFYQQLRASLVCPDTPIIAELTPGLSVHAGAGVVGAVLVTGA